MEMETKEVLARLELMSNWVIEDEDTGDVIGLKADAPDNMKAEYEKYLEELQSTEPVLRQEYRTMATNKNPVKTKKGKTTKQPQNNKKNRTKPVLRVDQKRAERLSFIVL